MGVLRFALKTILTVLLGLMAIPAFAQVAGGAGPHIRIDLVPESETPKPDGEVTLALASQPEPGWHGYWQNPGDAGLPMTLDWTLPGFASAGTVQYPVPQRLLIAGLMNYVFEDRYAPLVTLKLNGGKPGQSLPISVKLNYLVCTATLCVPESQTLSTRLTLGDGAIAPARATMFAQFRQALPKPLPQGQAQYAIAGQSLRMAVPVPGDAAASYFYPTTKSVVTYSARQRFARDGPLVVLETGASGEASTIDGVLQMADGRAWSIHAVPGPVPGVAMSEPAPPLDWTRLLLALGGAVLGGLLLNIMPCVFPILSIKALSLAKANAEGSSPAGEALAYTFGVVLVCLGLGAVLLGLRAAGSSAGWAFQLTDPRVMLLLLLLMTAVALNFAGLFELPTPPFVNRIASTGASGAFASGALAAFIATPCTGPFMGVALGAALVMPWYAALAVFGGLGLGLALPFLLLGFVPPLRRMLPKPGAWMETFRHILAVPMFATALAIAWVLGRQAGVNGMTFGLGAAFLLGFALWWAGVRQARLAGHPWLPVLPLIAIALVAAVVVRPVPAGEAQALANAGEERFTEARLAELQAQGRPVFAYFTADWCVTCKVNEKAVIETQSVQDALRAGKVAVLVGDWTNGDADLGRFIQRHNRAGVPLYLWYAPGQSMPKVLPQLLNAQLLKDLAAGKTD